MTVLGFVPVIVAIPLYQLLVGATAATVAYHGPTLVEAGLREVLPRTRGVLSIGAWIRRATSRAAYFIEIRLANIANTNVAAVVGAFRNVAAELQRFPGAVVAFAVQVTNRLDRVGARTESAHGRISTLDTALTETRIPNAVAAGVKPLQTELDGTQARIRQLTDQMWERAIGPVVKAHERIDGADARITRTRDELDRRITRDAVGPLEQLRTQTIPDLWDEVTTVGRQATDTAAYIAPIAAAIAAPALIGTLDSYNRCRPKTEKFCTLDGDEFDQFLGLALFLPSLALIVAAGETVARGLNELTGVISSSLGE